MGDGMVRIRMSVPLIGKEEIENVMESVETKMRPNDKFVIGFEEGFAGYIGAKYGISVMNGTAAIHLALAALGIKAGDEVIVPTLTSICCTNAISYTGAKAVFVDSLSEYWCMDPKSIEKKITKNTKVIMAVHLYGHPCDMDAITEIAKKHNLYVIEDCAEAHGAEYKGTRVGTLSDISCFSFYGNKIITTGEGGMALTNNEELAEKMRILRNIGTRPEYRNKYYYDLIGFSYRMSSMQAAVGLAQVHKIEYLVNKRLELGKIYDRIFESRPTKVVHAPKMPWAKSTYWYYSVLVPKEARNKVVAELERNRSKAIFLPDTPAATLQHRRKAAHRGRPGIPGTKSAVRSRTKKRGNRGSCNGNNGCNWIGVHYTYKCAFLISMWLILMEKKILVTGATGFIGSHLVQELLKRKYNVFSLMKYATNRNPLLMNEFLNGSTLVTCDIADYYSVYDTLKKVDPDLIVHLAALSHVSESFEKPFPYVKTNIVGTMNIAYALLKFPDFKRRKMIYASTAEVYGIQKTSPTNEEAVMNPASPYANTKAMTDVQLRMMTKIHGLNTTIMRCTNSYGRKIDTSFYIEYLVTTMLKGEKTYIGAPDSLRDYMYVSDHVNAYIKAIENGKTNGEAFNASTENVLSNKAVAFKIADMIGFDRKKIILGKYPPDYPLRPFESDQPFIALDSTKIRRILGWKPTVSLEVGLKKTIELWKGKLRA